MVVLAVAEALCVRTSSIPISSSTLMRREDVTLVDYRQVSGRLRDPLYIEGAVVIDCDGAQVLDARMEDLVDQLWAYLIAGAEALQQGEDFTTFSGYGRALAGMEDVLLLRRRPPAS